jgi:hypothetical protein
MIAADWLETALRGTPASWSALDESNGTLLAACETLEVSELLHHLSARHRAQHDWPAGVRLELARRAQASAARQLTRTREISDVLQALAARGIHPIVFKGAALSHLVYDSASLRPHVDTDILVRRGDIESVRRALIEHGYTEPSMSGGELVFCQFQMVKTDRFGIQHVLDVHWKISTQSLFADLLTYDELAAESQPLPVFGTAASATGWAHALLLACLHPVMHHRHVERLVWLYDVHLLMTHLSATDVGRFASLAVRKRVAGICARQLTLASTRLGTYVPPELWSTLTAVAEQEPSSIYLRPGRRWHHEMWWNVRDLGGWRDRLRLLREVLLPAPNYMLRAYHLGASGVPLLPVLYLHRGVYGAFKILVGRK